MIIKFLLYVFLFIFGVWVYFKFLPEIYRLWILSIIIVVGLFYFIFYLLYKGGNYNEY